MYLRVALRTTIFTALVHIRTNGGLQVGVNKMLNEWTESLLDLSHTVLADLRIRFTVTTLS